MYLDFKFFFFFILSPPKVDGIKLCYDDNMYVDYTLPWVNPLIMDFTISWMPWGMPKILFEGFLLYELTFEVFSTVTGCNSYNEVVIECLHNEFSQKPWRPLWFSGYDQLCHGTLLSLDTLLDCGMSPPSLWQSLISPRSKWFFDISCWLNLASSKDWESEITIHYGEKSLFSFVSIYS